MKIEISAGGLFPVSVLDFQSDLSSHITDSDTVISSFAAVRSSTSCLSGGAGTLSGALNDIDARIQEEEERRTQAKQIQKQADAFVAEAVRVDAGVSRNLARNQQELYGVSPWARPAVGAEDEAPWYEKAVQWLGGKISDGVDAVKKLGKSIKDFYLEHKKVIDTILVVLGAALAIGAVILTCGWALVPLLINVFGISAATAISISTGIGIAAAVTTGLSCIMDVTDIWCEIDQPLFNTAQKVLGTSSDILNGIYGLGMLYNAFKGYRIIRFKGSTVIQNDRIFDPKIVDSKGRNNYQRMLENLAPIGKDGKSLELHHLMQTKNGGLIELTRTNHRGPGRFKFWHNNLGRGAKSVVDHGYEWTKFKHLYWEIRGTDSKVLYDIVTGTTGVIDEIKSLVGGFFDFKTILPLSQQP